MDGDGIYQNFNGSSATGTESLAAMSDAANALQSRHEQRAVEIQNLAPELQSGWQGQAADGATQAFHPPAVGYAGSAERLTNGKTPTDDVIDQWQWAKSQVKPMPPKPGPVNPFDWSQTQEDKVRAYFQTGGHNVDVMNQYTSATSGSQSSVPSQASTLTTTDPNVSVGPRASTPAGPGVQPGPNVGHGGGGPGSGGPGPSGPGPSGERVPPPNPGPGPGPGIGGPSGGSGGGPSTSGGPGSGGYSGPPSESVTPGGGNGGVPVSTGGTGGTSTAGYNAPVTTDPGLNGAGAGAGGYPGVGGVGTGGGDSIYSGGKPGTWSTSGNLFDDPNTVGEPGGVGGVGGSSGVGDGFGGGRGAGTGSGAGAGAGDEFGGARGMGGRGIGSAGSGYSGSGGSASEGSGLGRAGASGAGGFDETLGSRSGAGAGEGMPGESAGEPGVGAGEPGVGAGEERSLASEPTSLAEGETGPAGRSGAPGGGMAPGGKGRGDDDHEHHDRYKQPVNPETVLGTLDRSLPEGGVVGQDPTHDDRDPHAGGPKPS